MTIGVKCPKCGLMQLAKETCESCGKKLDSQQGAPFSRRAPAPGPDFSIPATEGKARISMGQGKRDTGHRRRISFHGNAGALFGICLLNNLLAVLTLGIYSFWGKVKIRRYVWSGIDFDGDSFAYHGTGKELLVGFLKAMLVFVLPLALLNSLPRLTGFHAALKFAPLLIYGVIMVFIPVAMVGARRYRLSRTSWRGILFSFRGQTWEFVKLFLQGCLLSVLTLGLYYPYFETRRHGFLVAHSYFGNRRFEFRGEGRDLFKPYLLAYLLFIPTLGIYWFWFLAEKERYFWEHTSFEGIRFRSTVTGGRLLRLHSGNLLLLILTVGMGWPWVMIRKIRFALAYLSVEGLLDPATIKQEAQPASATGEVLAGFMDAGFDLG